jgi:hypothetical protein
MDDINCSTPNKDTKVSYCSQLHACIIVARFIELVGFQRHNETKYLILSQIFQTLLVPYQFYIRELNITFTNSCISEIIPTPINHHVTNSPESYQPAFLLKGPPLSVPFNPTSTQKLIISAMCDSKEVLAWVNSLQSENKRLSAENAHLTPNPVELLW